MARLVDLACNTNTTEGAFGFRYKLISTTKFLVDAEIITTAFDAMEFYVNGVLMAGDDIRPRYASRICANFAINPVFTLFAIQATFNNQTSADIPAVIATILLTFNDGSQQTLVTDTTWLAMQNPPPTFTSTTFIDSSWPPAIQQGVINSPPWDEVNIPNATDMRSISFDRNRWIWTDAIPASGNIPAGQRAFRRTFTPALGQLPDTARIIITADSSYQLFVNGITVGSATGFRIAKTYDVQFVSEPAVIVFAVLVTNNAGTAGLMMGSEINFKPTGPTGCIAGSFVNTEANSDITTWKSTKDAIPAVTGWTQPGFDDSNWEPVVTEGEYLNAQPWGIDIIIEPPTGTVTPV
ncbi:hypothetical protein C8R45DRAFT_942799 [Mycena sanguinolenta]|nr:hypothetical protein C8R45DRAFT_942799 [Mycena sanguinolenta]